jgi:hypothetical protein
MTPFAIGVVAGLMVLQASIAGPRDDYANCLHKIVSQAEAQKVAPDQYSTFAKQQCAAQGATFKAALVAFDTKNGVKRDRASSDADMQLDDYLATSQEKYAAKVKFDAPPKAAPAPAPVVPAAAPAPKKD